MALPGISFTFLDGQSGNTAPAATKPLFVGVTSAGTVDTITTVSSPSALISALGYGQVVDDAALYLQQNGGAVDVLKCAGSVAATSGSFVSSSIGTALLGITGAAYNSFDCTGSITVGGALGTAKFTYSLDGGDTEVGPFVLQVTQSLANTGLTLNAAAHTYIAGETFSFDAHPAQPNASDLGTALDAYIASGNTNPFVVLSANTATSAAAVTLASTLETKLASLESKQRFAWGLVHLGGKTESDATRIAARRTFSSKRIGVVSPYGRVLVASRILGRANPVIPLIGDVAAAFGARGLSSSPAATVFGSRAAVSELSYDEYLDGVLYDDENCISYTSYPNVGGAFITQTRLASPIGSDYEFIEDRRVVNRAATIASQAQFNFINRSVATLLDGSGRIDPGEAATMENAVQSALTSALVSTTDDFGNPGEVSGVLYSINRENNVKLSKTLETSVSIVTKARVITIDTSIALTTAI